MSINERPDGYAIEREMGQAQWPSCLGTKKGKAAVVVAVALGLLLVLHLTGALDGVESTLSDKVFTPIGNFCHNHKTTLLNYVLPTVGGVLVGLAITVFAAKKIKKYFNKKVEERVNAKIEAAFLPGGIGDSKIQDGIAEERKKDLEALPDMVDAEIEARKEAAKQKIIDEKTNLVRETIIKPTVKNLQTQISELQKELSKAQKSASKATVDGIMTSVASLASRNGATVEGLIPVLIRNANGETVESSVRPGDLGAAKTFAQEQGWELFDLREQKNDSQQNEMENEPLKPSVVDIYGPAMSMQVARDKAEKIRLQAKLEEAAKRKAELEGQIPSTNAN